MTLNQHKNTSLSETVSGC